MDPVRPDYHGACVSRIVPQLLDGASASWVPRAVAGATTVVLLVLDGLGWHELDRRSTLMPTLSAMEGGPITTVVPATTASALTSITTGLAPSQHALTGYRMRVDGGVLNVLRWHMGTDRAPDPVVVQRRPAFAGRAVPALTKSEFRTSGFTRAHLGGARFVGWQTTAVLVERCVELAESALPLVFAYYPGIDGVAHEYGIEGRFYERELVAADRLVSDLLAALPADTALLVTSDHGQVGLGDDSWVDLGAVDDLVETQAGDARFRSLYARPGAQGELAAAARERFGDVAWVFTRRELLADDWFGPDPVRPLGARIGDVVLAAHAPVGFVDPALPLERKLRSAHGAPTEAEMMVPLVAARGERSP